MAGKADLFFKLPKDWEDIITDVFMNGGTDVEAHLSLKVNAINHVELLKVDAYKEAFVNGMAISEAWWMKWARETLLDEGSYDVEQGIVVERKAKKIDTKLFEIFMKRMFSWDKKLDKNNNKDLEKKDDVKKDLDKFSKKYGLRAVSK